MDLFFLLVDDITEGDTTGNTVSIAIYTIVLLVVMPLVILPVLVVLSILLYRKFCGSHRHKSIIKLVKLISWVINFAICDFVVYAGPWD